MPWSNSTSCSLYFGVLCWLLLTEGLQSTSSSPDNIKFTLEPKSRVFVQRNRAFGIACLASGKPLPRVSWIFNGTVLKASGEVRITDRELRFVSGVRELRVNSPRVGTFRCLAKNTAGVLMSRKVQLDVIYVRNVSLRLSPPVIGRNARLECSVLTNQPVTFTWFRNNKTINATLDPRITALPSGVLQIRDFTPYDRGVYTCRVENEYEQLTSSQLRVGGQFPAKSKLHVYPGKIINTVAGGDVVIECVESGSRQSNISWTKVSNSRTEHTVLASGEGFANLEFHPVHISDGGEYFCQGKGVRGKVVVSVQAPAGFTRIPPAALRVTEGDQLTLKCEPTGNPKPSVTWFKNGRALVESSRVHFVRRETTHRLIVANVTLADKGVYQCEVENALGSNMTHTVFSVADNIEPPSNVKAYALSPTTVNVSWCSPSGYRNQKAFYSVHYQDRVDYPEIQDITKNHATFHTIKHLKPYTEYFVYVKVFTSGKPSRRSEIVTVRTLETEPTGPPLHVDLKSYSRGTLDITWLPPHQYQRNGLIIEYHIFYSMGGTTRRRNITVTRNFYSWTLRNLDEGREYFVEIAAKTHAGLGPFSDKKSCTVLRVSSARVVLPPPNVLTKVVNTSILVSVKPPVSPGVTGYKMTYRKLKVKDNATKEIKKSERTFNYSLRNLDKNSEYVINVTAIGTGSTVGRPAIAVVATKRELPQPDDDTRRGFAITLLPPMGVTCIHAKESTALEIKWHRSHFERPATEYRVTYFVADEQRRKAKAISTRYLNVTLYGLSPGSVYEVEIQSMRRDGGKVKYSSVTKPESGSCALPEEKPSTPLDVSCRPHSSSIIVKWRPPTKPNGKVIKYLIRWSDSEKNEQEADRFALGYRDAYKYSILNVRKDSKYTISVFAVNSVGSGPAARCFINTTMIKAVVTTQPSKESNDQGSTEYDDIKLGIIIGCVISLLFVALLVMFVLWSDPCGCRRHKLLTNVDVQITAGTDSPPKYRTSKPDTVSTEVSDASSKHFQLLQKYFFEEASKESDRGLGMTPKNSRLCLDNERIPFLPRTQAQDYSTGASFDSQDSGIQGLCKTDKGSSSSTCSKDAQKFPSRSRTCVKETVC